MVPLHDSDLAENRWAQAEWENFELWEKVERRNRRRRWVWIGLATLAFMLVSAVPVVIDRAPKWTSLLVARRLSLEISRIKIEAALDRKPYRIRVLSDASLAYEVERLPSCSSESGEFVRKGSLRVGGWESSVSLVDPKVGAQYGIPGLMRELCYDPFGAESTVKDQVVGAFAFSPVMDLANGRLDRASTLLLSGSFAEASFE